MLCTSSSSLHISEFFLYSRTREVGSATLASCQLKPLASPPSSSALLLSRLWRPPRFWHSQGRRPQGNGCQYKDRTWNSSTRHGINKFFIYFFFFLVNLNVITSFVVGILNMREERLRWCLFFWLFAENHLVLEFRLFVFFYFFMTYYKLFTK